MFFPVKLVLVKLAPPAKLVFQIKDRRYDERLENKKTFSNTNPDFFEEKKCIKSCRTMKWKISTKK